MRKLFHQLVIPFALSALAFLATDAHAQASAAMNGHHFATFVSNSSRVEFVTKRPSKDDKSITLCVPAAFTDPYNHIDGLAISEGKVANSGVDKQLGGACVLIDGDFEIFPTNGGKLLSDALIKSIQSKHGSLFQQFQLVKDGVAESFRDKSLFERRALVCNRDGKKEVVESQEALTLNQFAKDLADMGALNAIYFDMGDWDEGWHRDISGRIHVLGTSRKATDKQSNWVTFRALASDGSPRSDSPARAWLRQHLSASIGGAKAR